MKAEAEANMKASQGTKKVIADLEVSTRRSCGAVTGHAKITSLLLHTVLLLMNKRNLQAKWIIMYVYRCRCPLYVCH